MSLPPGALRADDDATRALVGRARAVLREHDEEGAARRLVRLAGARATDEGAEFGFWIPEAVDESASVVSLELELLAFEGEIVPGEEQGVRVRRQRLPLEQEGEWAWLAVRGATLGTRDTLGTLYRLVVTHADGRSTVRNDPLAASLPFGARAPAELYDVERMHTGRADLEFFRRVGIAGTDPDGDPPRFSPPAHVLEIHVGTATHGGTIADLADLYRALADKVRRGEEPTPAEAAFLGYDAVELMPLEPIACDPAAPPTFEILGEEDEAVATLRPPEVVDWGYDVALLGSAAIEPSLLRSGRPDELVDLAGVLHTFPGKPIRLVFDLVFGHASPYARDLLSDAFFRGEGEFGPRPDLRRRTVRALLIEMRRRKVDFGADGVRVDASHDLVLASGEALGEGDAGILAEMSDVVQNVADVRYRPFMIFEDGRRSPTGTSAASASYLEVIRERPEAFEWGPLTYADVEPFVQGYWGSVGWRFEEIADHGSRWINGYANHDTLRRAYRLPPHVPVNRRLGEDLPEILRRGYDHPAADLAFYGLLPGVPMSFLAATMRAPWAFFRNIDGRGAVALAAREAGALAWRFAPHDYAEDDAFVRLKALGLHDHAAATALFLGLRACLRSGAHEPEAVAAAARREGVPSPEPITGEGLTRVASAFLRDLRDACVVWRGQDRLDPARARISRSLRRIRGERSWLAHDLRERDRIGRSVREDGGVFLWGVRHAPDGGESIALLANLEGEPSTLTPRDRIGEGDWHLLLAAPERDWEGPDAPLTLLDAEGVLLRREA